MTITGEIIRKIRRVHGLTHRKMAEKLGVHHRLVQFMESGERAVSRKTERAVIEAFGLTPEKLARIEAAWAEFYAGGSEHGKTD